ncbi:hypothetical protein CP533_1653 [Ophiocordyceps camponoti-saundersi (nom. inval.)]|nr:hypothetical protein CP533_1653 [Ophiocordyceps camponoti-saundersi (nom. inval.)]
MIRPATALSVLLSVALALLLVSTLSVPIVKQIPLASFKGVNFGVFGFCQGNNCSPLSLGLNTAALLDNVNQAIKLPPNTRDVISFALILHPIAAAFALIITIMSIASHLPSRSHSVRYLLILSVLIFVTFLLSLAAFLVDILLFLPHLEFGAFLVVAATIVLAISVIASCAMRRAVVSRLAHKRRVEENADMSGEDYKEQFVSKPSFTSSTEPTLPVVGGDSKPQFAAFEFKPKADMASGSVTSSSPNMEATVNGTYGDRPPLRGGMPQPVGIAPPAGVFGGGRGGYNGVGPPMRGRGGFGSPPRGTGSPGRGGFGSPPRGTGSPGRGGFSSPVRGGMGLPNRVSPRGGGSPIGPPRAAVGARGGMQGYGNATRQYDAGPTYGPESPRSSGSGRSRYGSLSRADSPPLARGRLASDESRYSDEDAYIPPRAAWNNSPAAGGRGRGAGDFDVYSLYGQDDGSMMRPRSPADSERSGMTSISQRGVNPRWRGRAAPPRRPSNAGMVPQGLAPQKPLRRPDVLLDNPDFALGGGNGGARRGGLGMTPGSAYPRTAY